MSFFTVERTGFMNYKTAIHNVIVDMIANGFVQKFPATPYNINNIPNAGEIIVLEAGPDVDPLYATQPWRVAFGFVSDEKVMAFTGTPLQIRDTGEVTTIGNTVTYAGQIGENHTFPPSWVGDPSTPSGFGTRLARATITNAGSYPINYRLTTAKQGVFLGLWEGSKEV